MVVGEGNAPVFKCQLLMILALGGEGLEDTDGLPLGILLEFQQALAHGAFPVIEFDAGARDGAAPRQFGIVDPVLGDSQQKAQPVGAWKEFPQALDAAAKPLGRMIQNCDLKGLPGAEVGKEAALGEVQGGGQGADAQALQAIAAGEAHGLVQDPNPCLFALARQTRPRRQILTRPLQVGRFWIKIKRTFVIIEPTNPISFSGVTMARQPQHPRSGTNFQFAEFGAPGQWGEFVLTHPRLGAVPGKVFLKEVLGLTGMEVSLGSLPAGAATSFLHAHKQNEEFYLVLSGRGELQVDGEILPIQAGSAVRVAPGGVRGWRALGAEPMTYLVIQAKAGSLEQFTGSDGLVSEAPVRWS